MTVTPPDRAGAHDTTVLTDEVLADAQVADPGEGADPGNDADASDASAKRAWSGPLRVWRGPASAAGTPARGLRPGATGVVLLVVLGGGIGMLVDGLVRGDPGPWFAVGFVTTSILAALVADRSALFVAGVQAPLLFVAFGGIAALVFGDRGSGQGLLTTVAVDTALWMTTWFPALAAAAVPAAVIALVRSLLLRRTAGREAAT